jgi:hypothetical protein
MLPDDDNGCDDEDVVEERKRGRGRCCGERVRASADV